MKKFTNKKTYMALIREGRPVAATIKYLLACYGVSLSSVAGYAGVQKSMVSETLTGTRKHPLVIQCVSDIIGFDPWDIAEKIKR